MPSLRLPVLAALLALCPVVQADTLSLFTWADYIDPEAIRQFEQETGHKIHEVHYETDDLKTDTLISTNGEGLDIMVSSGYTSMSYIGKGWLSKIAPGDVPNARHIPAKWASHYQPLDQYAVPYLWGTIGIAWRTDKIKTPVDSWQALMSPEPALKGHVLMMSDSVDMLAIALKAVGKSMMQPDEASLRMAEVLLRAQQPYVKRYGYDQPDETAGLVNGEIWIAPVYNGDGLHLASIDHNVRFVIPSEGTSVWVDFLMVLEKSKHKKAAQAFIDFMNRPEIAARNSATLMFATPNEAALPLVPADIRSNHAIYPDETTFRQSEVIEQLPDNQMARRNQIAGAIVR